MLGRFKEAVQFFKKCLTISPSMTDARNHLGSVYQEMGQLDLAEREFRAAIADEEYQSRELPYHNLARLYHLQNKNQEALDYLDRALLLNERLVMAHNLKGVIYETMERYNDAIDSYNQALRFTPDDINIKFNLASAYFKIENYEKAKAIFGDIRMSATTPEMKADINKYLDLIKQKK
jgi:tetratricopeptide (TPR) repeat protein